MDHAELAARMRTIAPDGVQAALHLAGDGAVVSGRVAPGGRFASTVHFTPEDAAERDIRTTTVMAAPDRATLSRIAAEAGAGRLSVPVARVYPLAETAQAMTDFTGGTLGKLGIAV